jgi:uncharacterized membrane protein
MDTARPDPARLLAGAGYLVVLAAVGAALAVNAGVVDAPALEALTPAVELVRAAPAAGLAGLFVLGVWGLWRLAVP